VEKGESPHGGKKRKKHGTLEKKIPEDKLGRILRKLVEKGGEIRVVANQRRILKTTKERDRKGER